MSDANDAARYAVIRRAVCIADPHPLSTPDLRVLVALLDATADVRVPMAPAPAPALAETVGLTVGFVGRALERLTEAGIVRRVPADGGDATTTKLP